MSRRALPWLLLAFVATRLVMVRYAVDPDSYPLADSPFTADVDIVFHDAAQRITSGEELYTEVDVLYPPGAVPILVAPERSWPDLGGYRNRFVALVALFDLAGLVGVLRLARRWGGGALGPWAWVVLIALVGPLAYARFDLVPAVATVWWLERTAAGRWGAAGGWLGYGAITKLYPAFLLPLALLAAPRPRRLGFALGFVGVAAATAAAVLLLFGGSPGAMYHDALGSRVGNGVHMESTWGSLLLLADGLGWSTPLAAHLDSIYFRGGASLALEQIASLLTLAVITIGALAVPRQDEDAIRVAAAGFATLALAMGVSASFSPQFVVWLIALGAAVTSIRRYPVGWAPWLLLPVVVLTHFIYPTAYHLVWGKHWIGIGALLLRNGLVLVAGVVALARVIRSQGAHSGLARLSARLGDRLGRWLREGPTAFRKGGGVD